jgi:hypothetical protein
MGSIPRLVQTGIKLARLLVLQRHVRKLGSSEGYLVELGAWFALVLG